MDVQELADELRAEDGGGKRLSQLAQTVLKWFEERADRNGLVRTRENAVMIAAACNHCGVIIATHELLQAGLIASAAFINGDVWVRVVGKDPS